MRVCELEDIVRVCVFIKQTLQGWSQDLWRAAQAGEPLEMQREGEALVQGLDTAIPVVRRVQPLVEEAIRQGYTLDNAAEYEQVVRELAPLRDEFRSKWPFIDPQQVALSRAEFARGEYADAEDILRELQGQDS
jgi:hypothetical protein